MQIVVKMIEELMYITSDQLNIFRYFVAGIQGWVSRLYRTLARVRGLASAGSPSW
jgi:hypothetical protein